MEQNTEQSLLEMHVDYEGGNILKETTRWARFVSIVGFIGLGVAVLVSLMLLAAGNAIWSYYTSFFPALGALQSAVIMMICLIALVMFSWTVILLYRFSTLTSKGISAQDQDLFNRGLRAGKNYFQISGILAVFGLLVKLFDLRELM